MRDDKFEELLNSYQIEAPSEEQIQLCIDASIKALEGRKKSRHISFFQMMQVQMRCTTMEGVITLLLFVGIVGFICFTKLLNGEALESVRNVTLMCVGPAPLFLVPILNAVKKSNWTGMTELEAACKYNFKKLIAARVVCMGIFAMVSIVMIWLVSGICIRELVFNRLLMSVISFNVTAICAFGLGKKSMKRGVTLSVIWAIFTIIIVSWKNAMIRMYTINLFVILTVAIATCVGLYYTMCSYVKNVSLEREEKEWNLALIV